jgi:hypothetical protein
MLLKTNNEKGVKRVDTVEEAIEEALLKDEKDGKIVLMQNTPELIPILEKWKHKVRFRRLFEIIIVSVRREFKI